MYKIRLTIAVKDMEFAKALGAYLALRHPIFSVEVKDMTEELYQQNVANDRHQDYDLLLTDLESMQMEDQEWFDQNKVLKLSEELVTEDFGQGTIYRYSGGIAIASACKVHHAERMGIPVRGMTGNAATILGFGSAAGGVGTTSIALAVGRALSLYHKKKVLYLSLEHVASTQTYFRQDGGTTGLSEYLYYFLSNQKEKINRIHSAFFLTDSFGLSTFRPAKSIHEPSSLTEEEITQFLIHLAATTGSDYLIIDFPLDVDSKAFILLAMCTNWFLVQDGSPRSAYKNDRFLMSLSKEDRQEVEERMRRITNRWTAGQGIWSDGFDNFYIECDEDSFVEQGNYTEIRMDRSFGIGVMNLAKSFTESV